MPVARLDGERGADRRVAGAVLAPFGLRAPRTCLPPRRRCRQTGHWRAGTGCPDAGRSLRGANGSTRAGDRPLRRRQVGQRIQRQAETDRGIAGDEEQPAAPQRPDFAEPARPRRRIRRLDRQHVAGRHRHPPLELAHDPRALEGIVDLGVAGVDVVGPLALLQHPLDRILEGGDEIVAIDAEPRRHVLGEPLRRDRSAGA